MSALCIRRPVMTILLMASFIIAGIFGYKNLPVAAVPRVDFPTIQVTAQLPGASPETMAASVASILERQFSAIAGVTTMTSTSSLGNTSIVLQFDLNRNIDGAALDVQSQISAAMRRLPVELPTPPSFRKVNPADFPILFLSLKSSQVRLSDIDAFSNRAILPRISTLPGVAQVLIFGSQKYAVRVRANLDQLSVRGLTLNELQTAIVNANSTKPLGAIADSRQNAILDATGPLNKAVDYMPVVVAFQNGAPVRISDVATAIDSVENDKIASWLDGTRAILLAVYRQPDANTVEVVDRVKAMLPAIQVELPSGVEIAVLNDRSVSIRDAIEDVQFTLCLSGVLVIIAIYFFLRSFRATLIPAIALPISVIGTFAGMYLLRSFDRQYLAAGADARRGLRGRRCDRHAGEHRPPYRGRREADGCRLQGLEGSRLHYRLYDAVTGRRVHSRAVHGRRRRPHVQRVRHGHQHGHPDLGHRVADAHAHAVLAAPEADRPSREAQFPAAAFRVELQPGDRRLRLGPEADRPHAAPGACHHARHVRADRHSLPGHSQGVLPVRGYRPAERLDRRTGRRVLRRHGGSSERGGGDHQARSRRRLRDVHRGRRQCSEHGQLRPHLRLAAPEA